MRNVPPILRRLLPLAVAVAAGSWSATARCDDPPTAAGQQDKPQKAEEPKPAPRFEAAVRVVAPPIEDGQHVTQFATEVASVGASQIDDLAAGDLASALRRLPGVVISRYDAVGGYGGGDGGAIYVRGQGSGRPGAEIVTMIDGIPRFAGVWTHPLLDTVPSDVAERIDVYKSAQPVLVGNMAFAGVDLVPKRLTRDGTFTRFAGSLGELSTQAAVVENGTKAGGFDYYVVGSHRASDGQRRDADGRVDTFYGRIGYELAAGWSASVQVHADDSWAHDPGAVGASPTPIVPRFAVRDTLSIATLTEEHGSHTGSLKMFQDRGRIDWWQWDASAAQSFLEVGRFESFGVHARESVRLAERTEVVAGFDHDRYGGSDRDEYPSRTTSFPKLLMRTDGGYVMVSRRFGTDVEIVPSAGARYTDSADFGGNWGGQAGLVVRWGANEAHANVARAFNLPGVWTAVMYAQWHRGSSWRNLRPELDDHAELGVAHTLPLGRVALTVFSDRVTDALRFVPPPPPPPSFENIGAYTVQGAELTAQLTPHPALAVFGGVTYLDTTPADVPNSPRWSLVAGASWSPLPSLRLNADAERIDSQTVLNPRFATAQARIDGYFLLNMKASYRVPLARAVVSEVFVAGENVTGTRYEYRPGYPMPRATFSAGVDVRF